MIIKSDRATRDVGTFTCVLPCNTSVYYVGLLEKTISVCNVFVRKVVIHGVYTMAKFSSIVHTFPEIMKLLG